MCCTLIYLKGKVTLKISTVVHTCLTTFLIKSISAYIWCVLKHLTNDCLINSFTFTSNITPFNSSHLTASILPTKTSVTPLHCCVFSILLSNYVSIQVMILTNHTITLLTKGHTLVATHWVVLSKVDSTQSVWIQWWFQWSPLVKWRVPLVCEINSVMIKPLILSKQTICLAKMQNHIKS